MSSTVVSSPTAAHVLRSELGAATRSRACPRVGIEQADGSRRRPARSPRAPRASSVSVSGTGAPDRISSSTRGLGLGERGGALAVGDLAEVADDAARPRARRAGSSTSPRSSATRPPSNTRNSVATGSSGCSIKRLVERDDLVDPVVVEVVDEAACRRGRRSVPRKTPSTDGLMYFTRPAGVTTVTMSVACWTRARKRASLSPSTTRAWFDSSTRRVMRQATPMRGDAGDRGEHHRARSIRCRRGARPRAPRTARPRARPCGRVRDARARRRRPPRASRIDGCITAAASRKYAIGHSASSAPPSV